MGTLVEVVTFAVVVTQQTMRYTLFERESLYSNEYNIIIPFCYIFPLSLYSFFYFYERVFHYPRDGRRRDTHPLYLPTFILACTHILYMKLWYRYIRQFHISYILYTLKIRKIFFLLCAGLLGLKNQRVVRSHLIASRGTEQQLQQHLEHHSCPLKRTAQRVKQHHNVYTA